MKTSGRQLLAALVVLNIAGCSTAIRAGADFDRQAEFPRYQTFAWDEPVERANTSPTLARNPFFEGQYHGALMRELGQRGMVLQSSSPDLLVRHHFSIVEHEEILEPDPASDDLDEPRILTYEEGFFSVELRDATTGETKWRGWANGNIGGALASADRSREWIGRAVAMMFEHFPIQDADSEF